MPRGNDGYFSRTLTNVKTRLQTRSQTFGANQLAEYAHTLAAEYSTLANSLMF